MSNTAPILKEYGEVLDTKQAFFAVLKKKSKNIFLAVFISTAWSVCFFIFLPKEITLSDLGFYILITPWVLFGVYLAMLYSKVREAFWMQLALKYKWDYIATKNTLDEKALLFKIGHSPKSHHGISGTYNGQPFHIFEYQYTVGYGKHKTTYSFTVFEIKFSGTFPHLYLNYKGDWHANPPSMFSSLANISVPPQFADKFKLYSPKEYEIETLEIFTPEIFAELLDSKWDHDMEWVEGELVIYTRKKFNNFASLDAEVARIKKFIDVLSPRLNKSKLSSIGDLPFLLKR
ncbi:hypothetical protein A2738_02610 [Candidatus Nomurabacteria bacterium RIFCSPHIGHO2_01_FULL_42_15]|uniref:DUF3137 domain-containing protein n=1 Tax=Candidatus Nomurabacteria bacterium RIFCSPHIGHO2_01_FULL_42_15 TaxID=1801742 RepID=A0A1F6VEJ3_9BACT|nr:MAG: hypothetical protein A2738_02610 [Candidatus Nomurabacteria bacterium RIFCSPHIGHO2_01_FULL_42_15]OGI92765.1 MAG: hypothetical protein A3A99_02675 [Candidatus Nomurabacteria bacterium RIFCSPLOWO2_01_FULL_41_18]